MKKLLIFCIFAVCTSCSFDNKTGIWRDASNTPQDNQTTRSITDSEPSKRYENIFVKNKIFNEEINSPNLYNINIIPPIKTTSWFEQYATASNNISNFSYSENNILLSKSRKLSKNSTKRKIVYYKNNLISHDHRGTIFVYSLNLNKKVFEYNFYKKKFKNFNKKINFIIKESFLYVSDNLGYIYALNLENNSIIWAKNYGIPFRSNIKIFKNQIFLANQDNVIYSINLNTGDKNWQFATGLTFLKSDFENNFSLDLITNNLFFLNTSGELYSINLKTNNINWVLNFKNSSSTEDTELFLSQPIVIKNSILIITTEKTLLSYDKITAARNWVLPVESIFKPIITLDHTYIISKNYFLICLNNKSGNVVWSKNILANIKNKKIKKKFDAVVDFKIVNSKINIYSKNGYLMSFESSNGKLNYLKKISKNGIKSEIVFLDNHMLFIDKDNKLLKFN